MSTSVKNLAVRLVPLLIALVVSVGAVAFPVWAAPPTAAQISQALTTIADGRDPAFGTAIAPAQSLDAARSREERIHAVIARIADEIDAVTTAFATAPDAKKIAATKAAVARFSAETARDGASRSFEGDAPSLSLMRQLLFVPISGAAISATTVIATVSQFERSPKPDDNYYEYSDPADLKSSRVADEPGSAQSWTSAARPAMMPGQVYALKKCRHILVLGWYCNTALYRVGALDGTEGDSAQTLVTFLHPLPPGGDNAQFTDDRAKNIVDGYTALYVVVAADKLVLVYNFGIQSKAGAASQQGRLNAGHKEEYRQLVSRIEAALGTGKLPF